ncbi:MAG: YkgJ family cysteine cluster protein [Polyangiaceae bacterium]|nr:YkgJ family cysteine cluster protein [Polyangiaceae bacterium]
MTRGPSHRALRIVRERSAAISVRVRAAVASAPAGGSDFAEAAYRATDAEAERVLGQPGAVAPACKRGCSYCCHVDVEATSAEIDAIVAHLAGSRSSVEVDALVAELSRSGALSGEQRWAARIPCAFLAPDQSCSIHPVRPLRCRAFHSCDVERCKDAFDGKGDDEPVMNDALARAYDAAEAGLDEALEERGVSAAPELLEMGVLRRLRAT